MRIRAQFSKTEAMRFTGHLDLFSTLERTMRRANLPLSYSQGFNPRPKMTLASALPLGYTSQCELVDFWLDESLPLESIRGALDKAAPPGVQFQQVEEVPLEAPKLQNAIRSATFVVTLESEEPELAEKVQQMMALDSIQREKMRKGKKREYDLRELVLEAGLLSPGEDGRQRLSLKLLALESATGRPDDVLDWLGIDPLSARVHRVAIELEEA